MLNIRTVAWLIMFEVIIAVIIAVLFIIIMQVHRNTPITAPDSTTYGVPYVPPPPAPMGIGGTCMTPQGSYVIAPAACKVVGSNNTDGTCSIPTCANTSADQLVFTPTALGADAMVKLPKATQADCQAIGGTYVNGPCQAYLIKKSSLNDKTKYFGPSTDTKLKNKVTQYPIGTFYTNKAADCAGVYDPATKICSFDYYAFST